MIVLDLDGTILNSNGKVNKITKDYLMKLKKTGYIIVIATGRIYKSVLQVTDNASFANFIITDAGACTYDNVNNEVLFKNLIDKETAKKILKYYNNSYNYIDICSKDKIYKFTGNLQDEENIFIDCKEIFHITINLKENNQVITIFNRLLKEFPDLNIIIMQDSFTNKKWLEIMPNNCTKYNAIRKLSKYTEIPNESIIAFGDGLNDIEMLKKCGVGVALQNALPEVKEVADDITEHDYINNGVINYLKSTLK